MNSFASFFVQREKGTLAFVSRQLPYRRTLTALLLLPLVLAVFFWFSLPLFAVFLLLVCALAAWEWADLAGWRGAARHGYVALACLALATALWLDSGALKYLGLGWLLAPPLIFSYPAGARLWRGRLRLSLLGLLLLLTAGAAMLELRRQPEHDLLLLLFLLLVAGADTGAYLVGRRFGKHRLHPEVSPAKTWEGLLAGVATVLVLVICGFLLLLPSVERLSLLAFALVLALACVTGDLTLSMVKRTRRVAATGRLLPGHGGVLDRIDSSLAAAPAYTLGVMYLV